MYKTYTAGKIRNDVALARIAEQQSMISMPTIANTVVINWMTQININQ